MPDISINETSMSQLRIARIRRALPHCTDPHSALQNLLQSLIAVPIHVHCRKINGWTAMVLHKRSGLITVCKTQPTIRKVNIQELCWHLQRLSIVFPGEDRCQRIAYYVSSSPSSSTLCRVPVLRCADNRSLPPFFCNVPVLRCAANQRSSADLAL